MTNEDFKQEFNPVGHLSETQLTKYYKERFGEMDKAEQLERIATAAMQGLTSNTAWIEGIEDDWDEFKTRVSEASVELAKALINELSKKL